jgi:hypothetical protein
LVDIRKLDDEMHKSEGEGCHERLCHSDIRLLGHDNLPPGGNPWPGHFFPKVELIKYYVKDYRRWKWRGVHPVLRRRVSDLHFTYTEGLLAHEKITGWEGPKIINCDPNVLCYCISHGPKDCARFMRIINLEGFTRKVPPLQGNVEAPILHAYRPHTTKENARRETEIS